MKTKVINIILGGYVLHRDTKCVYMTRPKPMKNSCMSDA